MSCKPPFPLTAKTIQLVIWGEIGKSHLVTVPNYTPSNWFECDMWTVTKAGYATEYEIKISLADFKQDALKSRDYGSWKAPDVRVKHDMLKDGSSHAPSSFYYVIPEELEGQIRPLLPKFAGLQLVTRWHRGLLLKTAVYAPKVHKNKAREKDIERAYKAFYYRYWNNRMATGRRGFSHLLKDKQKEIQQWVKERAKLECKNK